MAPVAKRRRIDQPEEIKFDLDARQDYLSGFHKRKLQRIEQARQEAIKKEREERVKERRELRDQRKEDLEKHVAEFNEVLRKQNPDISDDESGDDAEKADEWTGINEEPALKDDAEYADEDKYTTVTVEPMRSGNEEAEDDDDTGGKADKTTTEDPTNKKRIWTKDKPKTTKAPTKKKQKFRYESKAERKATRVKQKSKNQKAAKARRGDD